MADSFASYQNAVLTGDVVTCEFVKQACQRNVRDLRSQRTEAFPYFYSEPHAAHAIQFIEQLYMTQGRRFRGLPFVLSDWQKFIVANLFGWLRDTDSDQPIRRFNYAYIEIARKGGKTELAAAMALYMLVADGEASPEIACAASRMEQAKIVTKRACTMARITPQLADYYDLKIYDSPRIAGEIHEGHTNGVLQAVASDKSGSQDGQNISFAVIDELHAHKDRGIWDALEFAVGSRDQPMIFAITTAGDDKTGIAYEQRTVVSEILNQQADLPTYFGMIFTLDKDDRWDDPAVWIKANPNLGISNNKDDLANKAAKAKISTKSKFGFMLKHLNIWLNEAQAWLDPHTIERTIQHSAFKDFYGQECYIGFDLSSKKDITSISYLFFDSDGNKHIKWRNYLPANALESETNGYNYLQWSDNGHIVLSEGAKIDYDLIYNQLLEDCCNFDVKAIGYDRTHAEQLVQRLDKAVYVDLVEVPQTARQFSDPMKELEADLMDGNSSWDGNPCVGWMLSNTQAKSHGGGQIRPFKAKEEKKIDASVAAILAYKVATLRDAHVVPFIQSLKLEDEAAAMEKALRH